MDVHAVRKAWERFVGNGDMPDSLRSTVAGSWQRSKSLNVDVKSRGAPVLSEGELYRRRADNALLAASARKAMERASQTLSDSSAMLILTDGTGHIIQSVGDERTIDAGREVHLQDGGCWTENVIGTNAIGTAIASRAPTQIHASEHFCEDVQRWTCAASPIFHPLDNELLGIIDISGPPDTFSTQSMALVVAIADHMEALIAQTIKTQHAKILSCYQEKQRKWGNQDLIAIDRRGGIVQCSADALKKFAQHFGNGPGSEDLSYLRSLPFGSWADNLAHRVSNARAVLVRDGAEELGVIIVLPNSPIPVPMRPARKKPAAAGMRQATANTAGQASSHPSAEAQADAPISHSDKVTSAFVASDPVVKQICSNVAAASRLRLPILITGQTGTGKELLARHAHASSGRKGTFVPVNCSALPEGLIEAELFGYADGAFTGARRGGSPGLAKEANGGTLFLDEIGDMPFALQAVLLRFLDDSMVRPVGGKTSKVDALVVSATNVDLGLAVTSRRFRSDLLYRLNTLQVALPPLADRGDFREIALFLLAKHHPRIGIGEKAITALKRYSWPGNIRELRGVLARLSLTAAGTNGFIDESSVILQGLQKALDSPDERSLRDLQRSRILMVYSETGGNISETARRLNVCRNTVYRALDAAVDDEQSGSRGSP